MASVRTASNFRRDRITFASAITFLQEEWRSHESVKSMWARERKALLKRALALEREAETERSLNCMLEKRVLMLEEALRQEREASEAALRGNLLHGGIDQPPPHQSGVTAWAEKEEGEGEEGSAGEGTQQHRLRIEIQALHARVAERQVSPAAAAANAHDLVMEEEEDEEGGEGSEASPWSLEFPFTDPHRAQAQRMEQQNHRALTLRLQGQHGAAAVQAGDRENARGPLEEESDGELQPETPPHPSGEVTEAGGNNRSSSLTSSAPGVNTRRDTPMVKTRLPRDPSPPPRPLAAKEVSEQPPSTSSLSHQPRSLSGAPSTSEDTRTASAHPSSAFTSSDHSDHLPTQSGVHGSSQVEAAASSSSVTRRGGPVAAATTAAHPSSGGGGGGTAGPSGGVQEGQQQQARAAAGGGGKAGIDPVAAFKQRMAQGQHVQQTPQQQQLQAPSSASASSLSTSDVASGGGGAQPRTSARSVSSAFAHRESIKELHERHHHHQQGGGGGVPAFPLLDNVTLHTNQDPIPQQTPQTEQAPGVSEGSPPSPSSYKEAVTLSSGAEDDAHEELQQKEPEVAAAAVAVEVRPVERTSEMQESGGGGGGLRRTLEEMETREGSADGVHCLSLLSHLDGVRSVCWDLCSAGGGGGTSSSSRTQRLLSCSEDATVKLWGLPATQSGLWGEDQSALTRHLEPLATYRGHHGRVFAGALCSAAGLAFSGGEDSAIRAWHLPRKGSGLYSQHGSAIPHAAGLYVGHTSTVWSLCVHGGGGGTGPGGLGSHPGAKQLLLSAGADATVRVWDTTMPPHNPLRSTMTCPLVSPQSASASPPCNPTCVATCPLDSLSCLAGYNNGALTRFDIETGEAFVVSAGENTPSEIVKVNSVAMHPRLPVVLTTGDLGIVHTFDLNSPGGSPLASLRVRDHQQDGASCVAIDPSGVQLATACHSGRVMLWDLRATTHPCCSVELTAHATKGGEGAHTLSYAPSNNSSSDHPLLASGGADGAVRVVSKFD